MLLGCVGVHRDAELAAGMASVSLPLKSFPSPPRSSGGKPYTVARIVSSSFSQRSESGALAVATQGALAERAAVRSQS